MKIEYSMVFNKVLSQGYQVWLSQECWTVEIIS